MRILSVLRNHIVRMNLLRALVGVGKASIGNAVPSSGKRQRFNPQRTARRPYVPTLDGLESREAATLLLCAAGIDLSLGASEIELLNRDPEPSPSQSRTASNIFSTSVATEFDALAGSAGLLAASTQLGGASAPHTIAGGPTMGPPGNDSYELLSLLMNPLGALAGAGASSAATAGGGDNSSGGAAGAAASGGANSLSGAAGIAFSAGTAGAPTAPPATRAAPVLQSFATPDVGPHSASPPGVASSPVVDSAALREAYGKLPLGFEANVGQVSDSDVQFLSRGGGYNLYLSATSAQLVLSSANAPQSSNPAPTLNSAVLNIELVGANGGVQLAGGDELQSKSNYFIGNNPSQWHTNVPNYGAVVYQDVYDGIDLKYYSNSQSQLEYDFVVQPGADAGRIGLAIEGASTLSVDEQGNLHLQTDLGDLVHHAPVAYQELDGARSIIPANFVLEGNQFSFRVGAYDVARPLFIDPVLSYSTFLGGSDNDSATAVAVDSNGCAYVTGTTVSTNFPTTSGAFQTSLAAGNDVFVSKLNATGTGLVYSTYIGGTTNGIGTGAEVAYDVALDANGNAYVTGETDSTDFPVTSGAFDTSLTSTHIAAFVVKLSANGTSLSYSTYLGLYVTHAYGIAVDSSGCAYVAGYSESHDFPTTGGAFQQVHYGTVQGFITKFNSTGSSLVYSTNLQGTQAPDGNNICWDIAIDGNGNAYVTGYTESPSFPVSSGAFDTTLPATGTAGFVAKLNSSGSSLVYGSYLDGAEGLAITVDGNGYAYITGGAAATNFPTTSGAFQTSFGGGSFDAFVTKVNADASSLIYSTYLGATYADRGNAIVVDASGNAYVTGYTRSSDFPTTSGAYQTSFGGGVDDAFVTKLNSGGSALLYSSFLGHSGDDVGAGIALDGLSDVYVAGWTESSSFPVTTGAYDTSLGGTRDAFVAKFDL